MNALSTVTKVFTTCQMWEPRTTSRHSPPPRTWNYMFRASITILLVTMKPTLLLQRKLGIISFTPSRLGKLDIALYTIVSTRVFCFLRFGSATSHWVFTKPRK